MNNKRQGEHFATLRAQASRPDPPASPEPAPERAPTPTPGRRGILLRQGAPVSTHVPVPPLARRAIRNPAPHALVSPPPPCQPVPEGFRLGHEYAGGTKKLRVSEWAATTVTTIYDG